MQTGLRLIVEKMIAMSADQQQAASMSEIF
jgi:hypothetical protein